VDDESPISDSTVADAPSDSGQVSSDRLGPAYAILNALVGDRIPTGPLGAESIPPSVLALPIRLAIEELVRHAKKCKNVRCPHVPPPLLKYRRMRPDAIRQATDDVYRTLWTHPEHELVERTRKVILARHGELVKDISSGELLKGGRLDEVLHELGPSGPHVLAAVLWASKFDGPAAEPLFRSLVPVADGDSRRTTRVPAPHEPSHAMQLRTKLRESEKGRKQAEKAVQEAGDRAKMKERAFERARQEWEATRRSYAEAIAELATLKERLSNAEIELTILRRDVEKATRVNAELRRDFRQTQQARRELEAERSDLALQLASAKRDSEHLKLKLGSPPRGAEAVRGFLREEEARIRQDQVIRFGGDRTRADEEWAAYRKLEKAFLDAYPTYRKPRPAKLIEKSSLRLITLGGSAEVGRSCYLLELGKNRILVDCGIKTRAGEDGHPQLDRLDRVDALIVTHAHTDHIGWIPALVRKFPDLDIYCSEGTAALLPVMLEDCHNHYMREMAGERELAKYAGSPTIIHDEYDEADVHRVPNLAITCKFGEKERLPFGNVSARFYPAGHVLGAASVLIEDQSGRRIFFSGDFASFPQLTVPAASWPADLGQVDLLVLESTYGNRVHPSFEDSRTDLIGFIRGRIETGGSVILASFGLGRAQELLSLLFIARSDGRISTSVPIHVDGMIRRINPIYRKHAEFNIPPDTFNEVSGNAERKEIVFVAESAPQIIVTTSGMLIGGPVVEYARQLLPNPRNRIVLTGYQDEGAPSRALRDLERTESGSRLVEFVNEKGDKDTFEAAMPAKTVGLSSHADQPGLIEYAGRLDPRVIALVHGEPEAQRELQFRLSQIHGNAEIESGPSELEVS
jgi:Cft2 family RNA processing exonuclease